MSQRSAATLFLFACVALLLTLFAAAPAHAAAVPASFAVYRPSSGQWFIFSPIEGFSQVQWGCAGCGTQLPIPADYDGDGTADVGIFSVTRITGDPFTPNARFIPLDSAGQFGLTCVNCVPAPHDYDGDGKAEFAVFDGANGTWVIRATSANGDGDEVHLGFGCTGCGDVPVPARFNALGPATPRLFTPYPLPTAGSAPTGVTAGPDGNLWFTERDGNRVGKITPAGVITEFPLPNAGSGPTDITLGPDGNLWFTERDGNRIGTITPAGVITEFVLPTAGSAPLGIANGPDGNMWFTESGGNRIGRITVAGVIAEFAIPAIGTAPTDIVSGPDGALWFTQAGNGRLGRLATDGTLQEFLLSSSPAVHLSSITVGPDSQLWVKGSFQAPPPSGQVNGKYFDVVWRVAVTGEIIREFRPAPSTVDGNPAGAIAAGADGRIWFAQPHLNRVGSLSIPTPFSGIAVYRRTTGQWFILQPDGSIRVVLWGCPSCGDIPVPRDYDGDGIADIAVYRPSTNEWFILRSSDTGVTHLVFGASSADVPVPADFDGDGKADIAVYRTTTGEWFVRRSSDSGLTQVQFGCGSCGDVPVPAPY